MQVGYNMINLFNITVFNVKFLLIIARLFESLQYFVKKWEMGIVDTEILTLTESEDGEVIYLSLLKVSLKIFKSYYSYKLETLFTFTRHTLGVKIPSLKFWLNAMLKYCLKSIYIFFFFFWRPSSFWNFFFKVHHETVHETCMKRR